MSPRHAASARGARRGIFRTGHHDENHEALARFMAQLGPEPIDTSRVGAGFPDLVWPFQGQTVLVEIKIPGGSLSPAQERFHREWAGGPLIVVASEAEILAATEALAKRRDVRAPVRG